MTNECLTFENRRAFREWLGANVDSAGVWLIFGKKGGVKTLTAAEALEEALCFGWIDGQMESLDEKSYRKYFAPRRAQSKWSEKNRKLVDKLECAGMMTDAGRAKIADAKRRGAYEGEPRADISAEQIAALAELLAPYARASENFQNMPMSYKKAYTGGFFSVKTDAGREKQLARLVERLELNLNPMESLAKRKAELGLT